VGADERSAIRALRHSHHRLAGLVGTLTPGQAGTPSFCSEWTIAQVCSHLGSSAELATGWFDAAVEHREPPGQDTWPSVWAAWDERAPDIQARDCVAYDEIHVERFEQADDAALAGADITLFGALQLDGFGLARLRLSEHAVHTWDIAVAFDPHATVDAGAVEVLVDGLGMIAGYTAKPAPGAKAVTIRTVAPDRTFTLDGNTLAPSEALPAQLTKPDVTIPAEALVRLVYGRLRPGEAGPVADQLRQVFPGL
jgi:uncharacterized protein (TIGR03083 family)